MGNSQYILFALGFFAIETGFDFAKGQASLPYAIINIVFGVAGGFALWALQ